MFDFVNVYGWWILGLLLLGLEVVLPGVYLLFFGVAALVIGANDLLIPNLSWESEVTGFVVLSVVAVMLGHRWYGERAVVSAHGAVNQRTARLVGRTAVLREAIVEGHGRVAIEDGWWSVAGPDLPAGHRVVIEGADGSVLRVRPADEASGDEAPGDGASGDGAPGDPGR